MQPCMPVRAVTEAHGSTYAELTGLTMINRARERGIDAETEREMD
jgi:hypothetical protein